jgi:glucosyl-dolichyl phosphate glucuronosyltransferase
MVGRPLPLAGGGLLDDREWDVYMKYTVAICTWNRASLLPGALRSVAQQSSPPDYEILVIDNGSTDTTRDVLAKLVRRIPNLRVRTEPHLGLSHARNRALREAEGDIVAFLDDDARPEPGWLESLDGAFNRPHKPAAVGGPVHVRWPNQPPRWFPSYALSYLGELDFGTVPRMLVGDERLRGLNMAVNREAAIAVGGFRTQLGRSGRSLLSGEDEEFLDRLQRAGLQVWWEPRARVEHLVDLERTSIRWLCRRAWMQGRSEALMDRRFVPSTGAGGDSDGKSAVMVLGRVRHLYSLIARRHGAWANLVVVSVKMAGKAYGLATLSRPKVTRARR